MFNGKWTTDGSQVTFNWVLTSEDYTKVFSAENSDTHYLDKIKVETIQKIPSKHDDESSESEEEAPPKPQE